MIGSLVGVLGGLDGFCFPIVFGLLSCWMYFALAAAICLGWMHVVIQRVMRGYASECMRRVEASHS